MTGRLLGEIGTLIDPAPLGRLQMYSRRQQGRVSSRARWRWLVVAVVVAGALGGGSGLASRAAAQATWEVPSGPEGSTPAPQQRPVLGPEQVRRVPSLDGEERSSRRREKGKRLNVSIGNFLTYGPYYKGAGHSKVGVLPVLHVSWRDRVFLVIDDREPIKGLGVNLLKTDHYELGGAIGYYLGRDEDAYDTLEGMGNIDAGLDINAFARFYTGPFHGFAKFRSDVSGGVEGLSFTLGGGYRHDFNDRTYLDLMASATLADESYLETYYGVSASQAASSGYAMYEPDGGLEDITLSASLHNRLTEHFTGMLYLKYARLQSAAADSPFVEAAGGSDQFLAGFGVKWDF